jgi:hypothetical protein
MLCLESRSDTALTLIVIIISTAFLHLLVELAATCRQRKLIDGVWRHAVHCPTIAEYRSHCKRQRFITFQPYMPHSALYMRDGCT